MKIAPTVNQVDPNTSFKLYEGVIHLQCEEWELDAYGLVNYTWVTEPHIKIKVHSPSISKLIFKRNIALCAHIQGGNGVMPIFMKTRSGNDLIGGMPVYIEGDINSLFDTLRFEIPNLFTLQGDDSNPINTLVLKANGFNILIQSENAIHSSYNCMDGGYILNGRGEITSLQGQLSMTDIRLALKLLGKFLSFIHGRRLEPMFFEGFLDGVRVFKYYPVQNIDENDLPWTWFTFHLVKKDNWLLESVWNKMYMLYTNDEDRDFLDLFMHFYAEANYNRNSGETKITIIQNALELLGSRILVEENSIVDRNDYDKNSASTLINILLLWADIPNSIPKEFEDLVKFAAAYNVKTGPQAITFIRNCIVHPHLKNREKFRHISTNIKQQVLRLSVYYTELIILKYLDYNGHYDDRLSSNSETGRTMVPWVKQISNDSAG